MKTIRIFSRILVGCVFIFSGFVKAVDPLGSTYKFADYFEAFNMGFFEPFSLALAILLSTTELVVGINLLLGIRMKITSWVLLVFMSGFTVLTFIIAIKNPVTDCGCFGDALILTNWQTFWKNIVLFIPTIIIVLHRKNFKALYSCKTEWRLLVSFALIGVFLSVYSYRNLPILDFRPYKTGSNIDEGMRYLDGAPQEVSQIMFTLKNGETGEIITIPDRVYTSTPEYWEEGSPWVFSGSSDPKIIEKGYTPPIHDFSLSAQDGNNKITDKVLYGNDYTFLLVSYDLSKASDKGFEKAVKIADTCAFYGYSFYCMTASVNEDVEAIKKKFDPAFDFYTTDAIALKTMIRSNPGLLLLKNGTVIRKWHYNNFPDPGKLDEYNIVKLKNKYRRRFNAAISVSFILGLLLLLGLFHRINTGFKNK